MEKFFSLEWFRQRIESSVDKALEERIGAKIDALLDQAIGGVDASRVEAEEGLPAWKTIRLVNEALTVVLRDGSILHKPNATEQDYDKIKVCQSKEEMISVIQDKVVAAEKKEQVEEAEKLTAIVDGFNALRRLKDFEVIGTSLMLKGTSRTIPQLLVEKFTAVVGKYAHIEDIKNFESALEEDDEYQGLKNFFMWCCLNPRAEVANSLYKFLDQNGMKITKQGFFVALRNVVEVPAAGDNTVVQFVSNAYNKVKAVWKKNPDLYYVLKNDNGSFSLSTTGKSNGVDLILGTLTDLYLDLPNMTENRFTDNWTRSFDIRIGQVVSMPSAACDWSTQDCARAGLHFAGHTAPYVLCGDTSVFTLHNPMKVVGIGREKGRCWEYLPFMTTTVSEANAIMNSRDFDFLQLDEEYAIRELEGLAGKAKDGFTTEASKHSFNLPSISTAEINSIVLSLNEMKKTITKRVSLVD